MPASSRAWNAVEQRVEVDRPATGRLEQAGHRVGELRRKVAAAPVGVDADADDDPRVVRPEAVALTQDAGELAQLDRRGEARGGGGRIDVPDQQGVGPVASITRSLGHLRWIAPVGSPATSSAASHIASATHAARRHVRSAASQAGRNPSVASSAAPAGAVQVRPCRPRPAVCSSATARQTSGSPAVEPAADDVVGRGDAREALDAGEHGRRGGGPGSRRQPAAVAAVSMVSGCSSSNAAWRARTASSTRSSAMIVVMRISEVEIISMLMPASASVPNIRAA